MSPSTNNSLIQAPPPMNEQDDKGLDRPAVPGPPPSPLTFSQELHRLALQFGDRPARLREVIDATQERGMDLILVLISLPFLTPVPLLGLSTPFGLLVCLIGAPLAFGFRPWLPQFVLNRKVPPRFIKKFLDAASRLVCWLEVLLRPRLVFLHEQLIFRRMAGLLIMFSGLLLLLPVPLPFTNTLPAITVLLLAAGAMERDGLFFICGCAMFALTVTFFTLLAFGGIHLVENLWRSAFS